MTPETQPEKDFKKAINALALELPKEVWNDFHFKWIQFQNIKSSQENGRVAELGKEVLCSHCGDPIEQPIYCRNCEINLTLPDNEY